MKFGSEPRGYRDIYWCWHLNEPEIMGAKDGRPHCRNCDRVDGEWVEGSATLSESFLEDHTFLGHIFKPGQEPK